MYTGVQVHIGPEYVDVGIQCDLPHNPVNSSNAGVQFGLCPLGASSPRTIQLLALSQNSPKWMTMSRFLMHQQELITHPTRVNHRECNYWLLMNQCVTIMIAVQWKMMFLLFLL